MTLIESKVEMTREKFLSGFSKYVLFSDTERSSHLSVDVIIKQPLKNVKEVYLHVVVRMELTVRVVSNTVIEGHQ